MRKRKRMRIQGRIGAYAATEFALMKWMIV